ncbi:MAG: hypothetical protein VKL42_12475 [Snowella sp.]|nr:hypothetical protein [Snowella sp.]
MSNEKKDLRVLVLPETKEKIKILARKTYRTTPSVVDLAIAALYEQELGTNDLL